MTRSRATTYGVYGMDKSKDYYRILGVSRDASTATIKRAFKRLARKLHPDVSPDSTSQDLGDLQVAYETLADAERRRGYDESLSRMESDRFAPFSWSFINRPAAGDLRRPVRPGSLSGEILLTTAEAAAGGMLPVDVPLFTSCPVCEGTGGAVFDCDRCQGEGKIERRLPVPVHIPPGVRDGTVFQVGVDDPSVLSILLTVHIRRL